MSYKKSRISEKLLAIALCATLMLTLIPTTALAADPSTDLSITMSVNNNSPSVGDDVTFTLVVRNNGPDDATGAYTMALLPSELTFVFANASLGSYNPLTGIWTIGNLVNGGTATLTLNASVGATGPLTLNGAVMGSETDSNASNNSVSCALTVKATPTLTLVGTAPSGNVSAVGDKTITVNVADSYNEPISFICKINNIPKIVSRSGNGNVSFDFSAAELNALAAETYPIRVTSQESANNNATDTVVGYLSVTGPPAITSTNSYSCRAGTGGTFQVTATGNPSVTYSLTSAPAGVTINSSTGLITVANTVAVGAYTFTVGADNGINPPASQAFTLMVRKSTPSLTAGISPKTSGAGDAGVSHTLRLQATGLYTTSPKVDVSVFIYHENRLVQQENRQVPVANMADASLAFDLSAMKPGEYIIIAVLPETSESFRCEDRDSFTLTGVRSVTISPAAVSLPPGGAGQFSADVAVQQASVPVDDSVMWSVDSTLSSIDQNGWLTIGANETAATLTVTATSNAANGIQGKVSGSAVVAVESHNPVDGPDKNKPIDLTKDLTITFPGEWTNVKDIRLNGVSLTRTATSAETADLSGYKNYGKILGNAKKSSVAVTLYKEFLRTLPNGTYTLEVQFDDGGVLSSGDAAFTIEHSITGLPSSYTLYKGGRVSWTPAPTGGTWDYDSEYLSMTKDGDKVTFEALKTGKTEATYTADGVSHTVSITINESILPQTGDNGSITLWLTFMLAALCGTGAILFIRKKKEYADKA